MVNGGRGGGCTTASSNWLASGCDLASRPARIEGEREKEKKRRRRNGKKKKKVVAAVV